MCTCKNILIHENKAEKSIITINILVHMSTTKIYYYSSSTWKILGFNVSYLYTYCLKLHWYPCNKKIPMNDRKCDICDVLHVYQYLWKIKWIVLLIWISLKCCYVATILRGNMYFLIKCWVIENYSCFVISLLNEHVLNICYSKQNTLSVYVYNNMFHTN